MMNFASLPTDTSYGNTSTNDLLNTLLGAYKNSVNQKDMQKQQAMQNAMQYSQPFGNEQDLIQNQMKMLQGYRAPEVQEAEAPSAAQMEQSTKQAQQVALAKYLNGSNTDQSSQPTTSTSTDPNMQSVPQGQMPPINSNAKYGQTSPNPMLMNGGQPQGQQPVQAVSPQLPQQQGAMQALQQGMQKPTVQQSVPQKSTQVDYSNIDTLPSSGNEKMDQLDKLYKKDPSYVENAFGKTATIKTYPNLTNGQMIQETTWPSGRKTYDVQKVTDASNGTTVFDPTTGNPIVQMGGGGAVGQIRPKQGEGIFYKTDDNGELVLDKNGNQIPMGTLTPYTEAERNEINGRSIMSDLQPIINNSQSYYSGKGSIERFTSDVDYVEKHPDEDSEQKRRLVDFKVSEKLVSPLAIKELATLGGSKTLGGFRTIQPSIKDSDLPDFMKIYQSFKVPASVSKEAGEKFLKIITDATNKAVDQTPAFQKRYYNIEDQKADKARALAKATKNSSSSEKDPFAQYKVGA